MTTPISLIEARLAAAEAKIVLFEDMIDPVRRVVAARQFKTENDTPSPQIIKCGDCGDLSLGSEGSFQVLDMLTEAVSHTGDTDETVIHTVKVPGGRMGPNGAVRISSIWQTTVGTAAQWWNRIYFGGTNIARDATTVARAIDSRPIAVWNKNDAGAQRYMQNNMLMKGHFGNSLIQSLAVDTTQDVDIEFRALCGHADHVVYLHYAVVEVCQRA